MQKELGSLLQGYRERAGLKKAQLAQRAGVSASFVTYIESGQRRPSPTMLARLMQALDLTAPEKRGLLRAAGYHEDPSPRLSDITEQLADLPPREREELIEEFSRALGRWRQLRRKRVRRVVIPIAGWQPRLLSPEQLGKMLRPALEESALAGLSEVILVLAPGKAAPVLKVPHGLKVRTVVQEPQVGLGHAILITQGVVGDEPFAVILPDDILLGEGRCCVQQMLALYEEYRCSVLAVTSVEGAADFKNYGIAQLGEAVRENLYLVTGLQEKPTRGRRTGLTIVGRYVLTPQIFEALQATPPDKNNELQLTDALNILLRRQRISAFVYTEKLFRVTPIKILLEQLIDALDESRPERLEQAMQITKEALHALTAL
uniref:UTP--glucose-1-phosphate uridylyltransferase n=2 Tax=Candidatus Bipolaricaulota TaxID=67810 RepID=H5SA19_9BACT|nr:UTP--glucose-1-phosphate uridylyltransferase [uncultured Acetothermia bacterium]BAL60177.1 UTP--glucose-1-phosphate uridylyltransferase [Candidatus Acetothermum autotrophicum]